MPKVSLDFVFFVIILLVIAAAIDLWALRAWTRSRRLQKRGTEPQHLAPAPQKPPLVEKNPGRPALPAAGSRTGSAPSAPAGKPPSAMVSPSSSIIEIGAADPPAGRSKRGGKTVSQKASLSVQGSSGRTTHVEISMELPEGESVRLTLESIVPGGSFPAEVKTVAERGRVRPEYRAPAEPAAAGIAWGAAPLAWVRRWQERGRTLLGRFLTDVKTSGRSLFILALAVYLLARLIGLEHWPIYFFTDEAIQTNLAAQLVKGHFTWQSEFLPTFLVNGSQYNLSVSVYAQIIPYLIFGKSVFVARGVAVLITLLGAAAVAWILRRIFRLPLWWSGALFLSVIPVWFLHSRTDFETAESAAFYMAFIYFYMRYREDRPWLLLPSLFFGALAAYTYSPAQVTVAGTGALLLLSDLPYHWRHKKVGLTGLALLVVLALPYARFLVQHPGGNTQHLVQIGSYWVDELPLTVKLKMFFSEYLRGFDPRFWYLPNPPSGIPQTIIRHLMKGYGQLGIWSLPFTLVGLLICIWNIRLSKFRTVLITLLAAPLGGAIAQLAVTRVLIMVLPAALLTTLGVSWVLGLFQRSDGPALPDFLGAARERAGRLFAAPASSGAAFAEPATDSGIRGIFRRWRERTAQAAAALRGPVRVPYVAIALGLFLVLTSVNGYMLWDSVANGPVWYRDYTLYGLQYGGQQLSSALIQYRNAHPDANLIVSTSWANGADEIFSFFLPEGFPMKPGTIQEYIENYNPIGDQDVFIMTPEEYKTAVECGRFKSIQVLQILPYPDGTTGFYFAHPVYIDNIQDVIAAEKAALAKPVEESLNLGGEIVQVEHSRFDMGALVNGFDGDMYSVMRTLQDNPMYLDMVFPAAHSFTSFVARVGGSPSRFTVTIYPPGGGAPGVYSAEVARSSDYREVRISLPAPIDSSHIRLEIETVGEGVPTHVHVYEIQLEGVGWKNGIAVPSA
jgi:hypothetical protein